MNDSALVTDETRAHIREVAARMWYTPHGAARSLITRRTHTIGVLLPDLYGEFFSEVIRGIDLTAQRSGYHCLISSARHDGPRLEAALRSMRGRVDGLVLMSPEFTGELSHRTLPGGFPVVLLNCPPSELDCDSLTVANYEGAYAMVRHFVGLGHRRIALINGAAGNFDASERRRGYHVALRDAGLPVVPDLEIPGDFTEESGHAAALALLALADRPTAIFAANDVSGLATISVAGALGLRVPEDLSVIGFDNVPESALGEPPLTTIEQPIQQMGFDAAQLLIQLIAEQPVPAHLMLPTRLVVRGSCQAVQA